MARGSVTPLKRKGRDGREYRVYRARVPGGIDPKTGKRRQATKVLPTRKAADAWVAEQLAGGARSRERMTVAELLDRWLPLHAREVRRSTSRLDDWAAEYIKGAIGHRRLETLKVLDVQAFYDGLDGLAPASVQGVHRVLGAALAQAVDWELIERNPARRTKRPPVQKPALLVWDEGQVGAFLRHTRDDFDGPLFALLLATGLRIGEALALDWRHVDLERGTLRVERTMTHGPKNTVVLGTLPKTSASRRRIHLPIAAQAALRRQQRMQEARKAELGDQWLGDGAVFDRGDGVRRAANAVRNRLAAINEGLGLPHLSPHGLRHQCATMLIRRGVSPKKVQTLLGHSNIQTTMNLYVHMGGEDLEEVAHAMDQVLGDEGEREAV